MSTLEFYSHNEAFPESYSQLLQLLEHDAYLNPSQLAPKTDKHAISLVLLYASNIVRLRRLIYYHDQVNASFLDRKKDIPILDIRTLSALAGLNFVALSAIARTTDSIELSSQASSILFSLKPESLDNADILLSKPLDNYTDTEDKRLYAYASLLRSEYNPKDSLSMPMYFRSNSLIANQSVSMSCHYSNPNGNTLLVGGCFLEASVLTGSTDSAFATIIIPGFSHSDVSVKYLADLLEYLAIDSGFHSIEAIQRVRFVSFDEPLRYASSLDHSISYQSTINRSAVESEILRIKHELNIEVDVTIPTSHIPVLPNSLRHCSYVTGNLMRNRSFLDLSDTTISIYPNEPLEDYLSLTRLNHVPRIHARELHIKLDHQSLAMQKAD